MPSLLEWTTDPPALRRPVLVVALDGFVDAGAAAGTAATFLRHRWQSELAARFDRDAFIDYRARRPSVVIDSGQLRRVEWPGVELFTATVEGPHDAALLLGHEPDMRWEAFAAAVVEACRTLGVVAAVGLGAYPAAVPHTRATRVMAAGNGVEGGLVVDATPIPGYTGPVGAATTLEAALGTAGVPTVGLWAEVPHYIAASPNPAAALALVRQVGGAMQTLVDTTELEAAAKVHREQVDEAVAEHPDAIAMVHAFERHLDLGGDDDALPSGDDLAAEIERFLRAQND